MKLAGAKTSPQGISLAIAHNFMLQDLFIKQFVTLFWVQVCIPALPCFHNFPVTLCETQTSFIYHIISVLKIISSPTQI